MHPDDLTITVSVLPGTGNPPQWMYRAEHRGSIAAYVQGPRVIVLESLERFVALFREESAPSPVDESGPEA